MSWNTGLNPQIPAKNNPWLDQMIIRQVRKEDLPAMEWDGEYAHFRRVYADAFYHMQRGHSVLWLAEMPGIGLLGQVFIQLVCDRPELADGSERAYLYSFRVKDHYRGKGIGSRMIQVIEGDLRQRGYKYLTLNVARDNTRAQQLYLRNGFRIIAPEPGIWSYMDEKGELHRVEEPAWRMEKYLY